MRTVPLQLENTVDPPTFHRIGDTTYDPVAAAFSTNTVPGSAFTVSAPFDNGDGLSQTIFGPPRYGKDGWWAFAAGIFTVPTITADFNIKICALPAAYAPLGGWGSFMYATIGIWGGAQSSAYVILDKDGGLFVRNDGTGFQNAQWGAIALSWPTGTYGE